MLNQLSEHQHYHRIIRYLHWSIALCLAIMYLTAYYRIVFTHHSTNASWYLLVTHMNVGALIFVLTVVLFVLHFFLSPPPAPGLSLSERIAARFVHYCLYGMLLLMPISAYIGTKFDFPLFGTVMLPGFLRLNSVKAWLFEQHSVMFTFIEPSSRFHKDIGADYILPLLLVGHIGAALYHHYWLRDAVLVRMWSGKRFTN